MINLQVVTTCRFCIIQGDDLMGSAIISFGSYTQTMKAQKFLAMRGIQAVVMRMPRGGSTGCGYGVRVYDDPSTLCEMLSRAGFDCRDYQIN